VAPVITGIIVHFKFHVHCICIPELLYFLTYFPLPSARHFCLRVLPHLSVFMFSLFCFFNYYIWPILLLLLLLLLNEIFSGYHPR
jgi:hypothetical protein